MPALPLPECARPGRSKVGIVRAPELAKTCLRIKVVAPEHGRTPTHKPVEIIVARCAPFRRGEGESCFHVPDDTESTTRRVIDKMMSNIDEINRFRRTLLSKAD